MNHRPTGFSLVELLAAMLVGSFLLFAAATMLGQAGQGYDRGSGGVAAEREGRAVVTQIAEDLSKAVWHVDSVIEEGEGGWKRARLGFLSLQAPDAQSDDGRIADACAIHYYVKDLEIGGSTVRCLMRGFRESAEVFDTLANGSAEKLFDPQDKDEPVAFGVIAFEAEPLRRDPITRKLEAWTSGADEPVRAVRLKLVVARRELIGRLQNAGDWDGNPALGDPDRPQDNRYLETYELTQRFGNEA